MILRGVADNGFYIKEAYKKLPYKTLANILKNLIYRFPHKKSQ